MTAGRVDVVGTGPAGADWLSPETARILAAAEDLVGYPPYLRRVAASHHRCHASDNREEAARAAQALDLAAAGRRVAVVSGGDPGIFAMAAALCAALDRAGPDSPWQALGFAVHPGISALQAAAARVGAPLGNDFCAISLSDNLKPWDVVARRVQLAARADFAMAFYNPRSRHRPWQLAEALRLLRAEQAADTPVVFAAAIGRDDEQLQITRLGEADASAADMRTLVLVGNSSSRVFHHGGRLQVYTPRDYPAAGATAE